MYYLTNPKYNYVAICEDYSLNLLNDGWVLVTDQNQIDQIILDEKKKELFKQLDSEVDRRALVYTQTNGIWSTKPELENQRCQANVTEYQQKMIEGMINGIPYTPTEEEIEKLNQSQERLNFYRNLHSSYDAIKIIITSSTKDDIDDLDITDNVYWE